MGYRPIGRRPGFERLVVPLAPLPLSGWNTVSCSLVFTPPGGWFSEGVGGCCPAGSSYGWGVYLAGETAFSLAGKRDVFILQLVFCLPGWGVHLAGETAFSFVGKVGYFYLAVGFFACPAGDCFSACPAGAKTTFSFACKRKSGSGLRKRKGRPVEILGRCGTTRRWICTAMVSLG